MEQCETKRSISQTELRELNEKVNEIDIEIQNIKDSASEAPARIVQIDQQELIINKKIIHLKKKLAEAEQ